MYDKFYKVDLGFFNYISILYIKTIILEMIRYIYL